MKLKLIVPKKGGERELFDEKYISFLYGINKYGSIPLALTTIAGLTPPDVEVEIIDENVKEVDYDDPVDLVGITCNTMLAFKAYRIADKFRERGVSVILGGIHVAMLPEEAKRHADSIVIGEAELIWKQVIDDFKHGHLQSLYHAGEYADLTKTPAPRNDLIKSTDYLFSCYANHARMPSRL